MKLKSITYVICCLLLFSCNNQENTGNQNYDRAHKPWVFRSVLDQTPRMLTMALHDNLWVAYNTQTGAFYKAWKGYVDFDGAVYTTAHGPQPLSIGDAFIINQHENPWIIQTGDKTIAPNVQFRGHRFINGQAQLQYELSWEGQKTMVFEIPEYFATEGGLTGLQRNFTTANLPEGVQVGLKTNVGSIALKEQIQTDGTFNITKESTVEQDGINAVAVDGILLLNSNGSTTFSSTFVKKPLYKNENKTQFEEDEERPGGYKLIARADCKSCHNTYKKTIGPAYVDIAKKYQTTEDNTKLLINKIKNGGSGVWGSQVMSAHPDLAETDIRTMVEYILSLDKDEEAVQKEEVAPEDLDYVFGSNNIKEAALYPGLVARLLSFKKSLKVLADLKSGGTMESTGIVQTIRANAEDLKGLESNFAIIFEGYLKIERDDLYQFRLTSDDGSILYIGDKVVINHDGLHGADDKDGSIPLKAGLHPIRVEYFQGAGGKSVFLRWKPGKDATYDLVPKNVLFHHPDSRPEKTNKALPLVISRRIPGDGFPLNAVHPSYDLSQARPVDFLPKVGGMDFLSDGRLVISTWDAGGPIYILEGVQSGDPEKIKVKKIAEGLAEPLGLKVVDDEIYVLQKQELTKLIDHNGDEMIDEYQTVCNGWKVSSNFHEFAFGLVYKDGHFYATLATAIEPGGASTQPQIPDRGKVVKISKADGSHSFVAHGLRTPNGIGLGMNNEIFVSDNQGDWLPASKVVHIQEGAWYGSRSVDFEGTANLKETLPIVWLPQDEIGNSPSTPMGIQDGPYKGQLMHGEVTNGGIKRVFTEKINGQYQGALFRFIQGLEAGVNRMVYGPDGGLYIGGIGNPGNWRHDGRLWYGLQRVQYNDQPTFEMLAVRAKSNGLEIEFTEPLNVADGWNANDYEVKQFRYEPTKNYGGPKLDVTSLNIKSVSVSDDRKRVFLELDGMKENHVLYLMLKKFFVSENNRELWSTECWYNMNQIPTNTPGDVKIAPVNKSFANTLSDHEKAAGWRLLFDGKTTTGWRNFKKQTIGSSWKIQDGTIMLDVVKNPEGGTKATDGGDIITNDQFENFELALEWKISDCGNSGIMYNVVESDDYHSVWQTGPEMQVLDNSCHPDARFETHRAGDLYDMIACNYEVVNPAGQWNKVKIRIQDGHVQHWLNGRKVVDFQMFDDNWTKMIANSKFKDMEGFGKSRKGHISLQDHSDRVWYRNIKIRELKKES